MNDRNRALNGDIVVVSVHPRTEWKVGLLIYTPRVSDSSRNASTILSVVNVVNAICMRRMTSLSRLLDKIFKKWFRQKY